MSEEVLFGSECSSSTSLPMAYLNLKQGYMSMSLYFFVLIGKIYLIPLDMFNDVLLRGNISSNNKDTLDN